MSDTAQSFDEILEGSGNYGSYSSATDIRLDGTFTAEQLSKLAMAVNPELATLRAASERLARLEAALAKATAFNHAISQYTTIAIEPDVVLVESDPFDTHAKAEHDGTGASIADAIIRAADGL